MENKKCSKPPTSKWLISPERPSAAAWRSTFASGRPTAVLWGALWAPAAAGRLGKGKGTGGKGFMGYHCGINGCIYIYNMYVYIYIYFFFSHTYMGISMGCQWDVNFQWDINGISTRYQWDINGMSMGCQWDISVYIYILYIIYIYTLYETVWWDT